MQQPNNPCPHPSSDFSFSDTYRTLPSHFYEDMMPAKVPHPQLILFNPQLAIKLGLNADQWQSPKGISMLAGNKIPPHTKPLAQAYAGHQFGHFTMLGDGRAILMGEVLSSQNERFDLQWKGSGRTRYSRGGDGKATLGPMLREYVVSEAMAALGIPTTRSLAVVGTGENIQRDTILPGALLLRVASSHLRVGTFAYAAAFGSMDDLKQLADYAIQRHYPSVLADANPYVSLLYSVIDRQASLIAKWMQVGFVHGVMNTDNMTISGETIDYGPCAFMDRYDPTTVFSSIDRQGRYAYGNQPSIAQWNLARLAEALLPLLGETDTMAWDVANTAIASFSSLYQTYYDTGMRAKLGLANEEVGDESLVNDLLSMMHMQRADYTHTFYALTRNLVTRDVFFSSSEMKEWLVRWQARRKRQEQSIDESILLMKQSNPSVIARNHKMEEVLDEAQKGNYLPIKALLDVVTKPYLDHGSGDLDLMLPPENDQPYRTFCGT